MKEFLFIEANQLSIKAMHIAKELGFSIHFFTSKHDHFSSVDHILLPSFVDNIHIVNTKDFNDVLSYVDESKVGAVITFAEQYMYVAAQIASYLGLPHTSFEGLQNTLDKQTMKSILLKNGVKLPKFKVAIPSEEAQSHSKKFIIEEYLDSEEYIAECIWDGKKWTVICFVKIILSPYDQSSELDYCFLNQPDKESLKNSIVLWLSYLKLDWGIAHVKFRITNNEAIFMGLNIGLDNIKMYNAVEKNINFNIINYLVVSAYEESNLILSNFTRPIFTLQNEQFII